jgi:hypothetical protein
LFADWSASYHAFMPASQYEFDVLVIGAGHAGTEAAAAAARLGARTALLTTNCDTVGQMSCNPAIGGVAKGQIVREIDALGGLMGRAIDSTGIQFRMLNRRKGPAMHSPRAQADKKAYQQEIKRLIEEQPGLVLRQEIVEDLLAESAGDGWQIAGVAVRGGAIYRARAVVLTGLRPASAARSCGWDFNWRALRPARRRGSTAARSTTIAPNCSRATTIRNPFRFSPARFVRSNCPAGSRILTSACMI